MIAKDITLLQRLVEIPSVSRQEANAVAFFVAWMNDNGFAAHTDAAGNAVGILDGDPGPDGEAAREIVLLGHIDTVPGDIIVRIEDGKLYGRGTVDAKGPLAAFALAALRVEPQPGWRIIVIGAVEEEAATSKGARYVVTQYAPDFVIIGEPSSWRRVTLGYKGRLLVDASVRKRMAHTARPESSVVEDVIDYWIRVKAWADALNAKRSTPWEWVMATIRNVNSDGDGIDNWATMRIGIRLPLDISPDEARNITFRVGRWGRASVFGRRTGISSRQKKCPGARLSHEYSSPRRSPRFCAQDGNVGHECGGAGVAMPDRSLRRR